MLANIIRNAKKSVSGGDPYFSAVSLLLPMDGADGSTTFTDASPNALTVTPTGDAKISTAQSKYGASGYFDGAGDYLSIPWNSSLALTGDFTVEAWIYPTATPNGSAWIAEQYTGGTNTIAWCFGFVDSATAVTTGSKLFFGSYSGSAWSGVLASTGLTLNQWSHVAAVRIGTTLTIYLNGTAVGSGTFAAAISTGDGLYVGRRWDSYVASPFFQGYLDDIRISRFARYTSTFTPPSQAHPTYASSTPADPYYGQTSLLLHMDGANGSTSFVDSGPNAFTVTASGSAAISTTQSKFGGASASLNASTNTYLSIADNDKFYMPADFTIEAWVWIDGGTGAIQSIYSQRQSGSNGFQATITYNAGVYQTWMWIDSTHIFTYQSGSSIPTGQWVHLAWTRSGTTFRSFINGVLNQTSTSSIAPINEAAPVIIGETPGYSQIFKGYIDDLRVTKGLARYQSSFTPPTQALPEYLAGNDRYYSNTSLLLHMDGANGSTTFTDSSLNSRAITAVGNTNISTSQSQFGGASGYFDGTGDYLSFTGGMPSGTSTAFTIECWIRLDDLANYRAITRTVGGLDIGVQANGMIVCDQTQVGVIADSATGIITAGTWYHIAVTRDTSNGYKVYVNGTQVASGTNAFSVTAATTIGYSAYSGSHYFKGYIDDFRVTNALRYTASFTPPTSAFPNS